MRNKTIDFSLEDGQEYLKNAVQLTPDACVIGDEVCIVGDTFLALEKLPKETFDLLLVDPPYNLFKN